MSQNNNTRWTSDHLLRPAGTAVYAQQQRERLRQMADDVRALLHEYQSDLAAVSIDGDKPFEARIRAFRASRPLADLEKSLRAAIKAAGRLDPLYQRYYVQLPVKRKEKADLKQLEKDRKAGISHARAVNTATQIQGFAQGIQEPSDVPGKAVVQSEDDGVPDFIKMLQKRA